MRLSTIFNKKTILFAIATLLIPAALYSQGVVVTEDTKEGVEPHESSIFDIRSKDKGILIPRMTTAEREAIGSPANGLMVYDEQQSSFFYYDSSAKGGKGGWVRTMAGDADVIPGIAGRVAYFQDANTISAHSSVELSDGEEDPIFVVKNSQGQVVFAVYEKGVRIYVEDDEEKTSRGGFAIGGFTTGKDDKEPLEYLRVTPTSTSIFMEEPLDPGKTSRGGFAIGGFTTGKGIQEFMRVTADSTRVYIKGDPEKTSRGGFAIGGFTTGKGMQEIMHVTPQSTTIFLDDSGIKDGFDKTSRGGFAIGGFTTGKGMQEFMRVTADSTRIYIDDRQEKTSRGGFAIGGFTTGKSAPDNFFNVETGDAHVIDSEARILWYPQKEAFLAGRVKVESPDDVGTNSWASGYHSKSIGDWSQALGYKAIARGDYSTAIGQEAVADSDNSFAFGQYAQALDDEAYAFGGGALAEGYRSFAFGSSAVDSLGQETAVTRAIGDYSFAIGQGATTIGVGAFALGLGNIAVGNYSIALGYETIAEGFGSTVAGIGSTASGSYSVAMGRSNTASGDWSVAIGTGSTASGNYSVALGRNSEATHHSAYAMGPFAKAYGGSSIALMYRAQTSAAYSLAAGYEALAEGMESYAIGYKAETSGRGAVALGYETNAQSFRSVVVGTYNEIAGSTTAWNNTDPIFVVGNGPNNITRRNAMTILKNGNVGIGTTSPAVRLHTTDGVRFETLGGQGTRLVTADEDGNLLTSNALGLDGSKLGIGTTNPTHTFHVRNDSEDAAMIIERNSTTIGHTTGIRFKVEGGASGYEKGGIFFKKTHTSGRGSLHFATTTDTGTSAVTADDARMTISATGNVGIGTSSPFNTLHVDGSVRLENLPGSGNYVTIDANGVLSRGTGGTGGGDVSGSGISGRVARWTGSTTLDNSAIRDDGENIAIGASVSGNHRIYANHGVGNATIRGNNTFGTTDGLAGVAGTSASAGSGYLATLQGSSTTGIRAGVYGVMGTHSNTSTLYAGYFDGRIAAVNNQSGLDYTTAYFENTSSSGYALHAYTNSSGGTALFANRDPNGYSLRCDTWDPNWKIAFIVRGSNVGIGVSQPDARLHIDDDDFVDLLRLTRGSDDWNFRVSTHGRLYFRSGTSTRLAITNDGNVGIGTIAPSEKLDVDGQIRIRGGSPGAGKVLTSDANGVATWQDAAAGGGSLWTESGSNIYRSSGNVGIGVVNPSSRLHVVGSSLFAGQVSIQTSASGQIWFLDHDNNFPTIVPNINNTGNLGLDKYRWTNIYVNNAHTKNMFSYSDKNLKSNINNLSNSLDKIMRINGYSYSINPALHPALKNSSENSKYLDNYGFIAQELISVVPEMVERDEDTGYYMIRNYEQMLPIIVEAMKELKTENDELRARLDRLERIIAE